MFLSRGRIGCRIRGALKSCILQLFSNMEGQNSVDCRGKTVVPIPVSQEAYFCGIRFWLDHSMIFILGPLCRTSTPFKKKDGWYKLNIGEVEVNGVSHRRRMTRSDDRKHDIMCQSWSHWKANTNQGEL